MEFGQVLQALLSLAFVLGLLMLTLWAVKYIESKGIKNKFINKLSAQTKINVIETKKLDAKNSISIVTYNKKEYVILLNPTQSILLDTIKEKENVKKDI